MNHLYITDPNLLDDVIEDLYEYKKLFIGDKSTKERARVFFDKETKFTDPSYKELMELYTDRGDAIPQAYLAEDGSWEGVPRLIQIGTDPVDKKIDRQYILDMDYIRPDIFNLKFKKFLEEDAVLVGQNIKYDLSFLTLQYGIFPQETRCTQLIAMLRNNGDNLLQDNSMALYRLDALYERYIPEDVFIKITGMSFKEFHKFKKENQVSDWSINPLTERQLTYSAGDVEVIAYLYHYLMKDCQEFAKKYPKSKLARNIKIECDFTLEAALMQSLGMGYDSDYQKNYVVSYLTKKLEEAESELVLIPEMWIESESAIKCPKTNPHTIPFSHFCFTDKSGLLKKKIEVERNNSSTNLARVIIENLGFELPKTEKGGDSVKGEVLRELYWKSPAGRSREILGRILNFRKADSFLSKNGENQLKFVHTSGRCHPQFKQLAAETARLAATKPAVMTIPKHDKLWKDPVLDGNGKPVLDKKGNQRLIDAWYLFGPSYISREGYIIIDGDWSNEEVRVIGEYTGDREIITAFQRDDDLHQLTADNIGVDRFTGKLFFLSSMYGAYERRIMENIYDLSGGEVELGYEQTKAYRAKHFEKYSGLKAAIDECADYVEKALKPYPSLTHFTNRKPLMVEITKNFGAHRLWCLTAEQERRAYRIKTTGIYDWMHRDHKVINEDTGRESTWNNEYNKTKNRIIRELFNYRIQTECSYVLKTCIIDINRRFRKEGFDPVTEGVIMSCHDEVATEVKEKHFDKAKEIQEYCMITALEQVLKRVPAKVELGWGYSLYEASPK